MLKQLKLKLAKMLSKFEEVITDKGLLICDGELAVGKEVFLVDADGDYVIAPDGDYKIGETIYVVIDGMISEVKEPEEPETEPEETFEEEPEVKVSDDIQSILNDLLEVIKSISDRVSNLENKSDEFSALINKSGAKPVEVLLKDDKAKHINNDKYNRLSEVLKSLKK